MNVQSYLQEEDDMQGPDLSSLVMNVDGHNVRIRTDYSPPRGAVHHDSHGERYVGPPVSGGQLDISCSSMRMENGVFQPAEAAGASARIAKVFAGLQEEFPDLISGQPIGKSISPQLGIISIPCETEAQATRLEERIHPFLRRQKASGAFNAKSDYPENAGALAREALGKADFKYIEEAKDTTTTGSLITLRPSFIQAELAGYENAHEAMGVADSINYLALELNNIGLVARAKSNTVLIDISSINDFKSLRRDVAGIREVYFLEPQNNRDTSFDPDADDRFFKGVSGRDKSPGF